MSSGSLHAGWTNVNSGQEVFVIFIEFSSYNGCRVRRSFSLGVEHHSEWSWAGEGKWGWDTKWSFFGSSLVWCCVEFCTRTPHSLIVCWNKLYAKTHSFISFCSDLHLPLSITKYTASATTLKLRFSMQDTSLNNPHWLAGLLNWRESAIHAHCNALRRQTQNCEIWARFGLCWRQKRNKFIKLSSSLIFVHRSRWAP